MLSLSRMRLNNTTISKLFLGGSYSYVLVLVLSSLSNFFFWDTVQLASKHALFFFDTNFGSVLLPTHLDSGHIPTFGWVLAVFWKLFGKTLWIGHLLMLPFGIGIVYQLQRLSQRFISAPWAGVVTFLILLDPTLSSQLTLVTPDIPLVFAFLWLVNSVLSNSRKGIAVSVALLFLISMRGMMIAFCVLLLDIFLTISLKDAKKSIVKNLFRKSLAYLPAVFIFLTYFGYHYAVKGWVGFHADSPWAESFARVGWTGFLRNIGILGWRLIDFGRIGIWLVLGILLVKYQKQLFQKKMKPLLWLALVVCCLLPLNMLWAKGLLGHRYLLPMYLLVACVVLFSLASEGIPKKLRTAAAIGIGLLLLSGNGWIYPPKVAQGWDASLAHQPYYSLRLEALEYLEVADISSEETASFFPNIAPFSAIDLNEKPGRFQKFDGNQHYVFYSNVFNLTDEEWRWLEADYSEVKRFEARGVWVAIYSRNRP
ncbi:hypothetical protein [Altibacter sp. HG106]|uniref:hypothetical protein n=1 Tax=Altibacter sp. HG106 TaxID=3023937 RepID=UPI0023503B03|nr:hypothetical protein [Altibacter sp. HG106]MDC7993631.1 hypothetical protein [Altibacter sp. HG106]